MMGQSRNNGMSGKGVEARLSHKPSVCLVLENFLVFLSDPFSTLSTLLSVLRGCSLRAKSRATRSSSFWLGSVDGRSGQEIRERRWTRHWFPSFLP